MNLLCKYIRVIFGIVGVGLAVATLTWTRSGAAVDRAATHAKERARVLLSQALPKLQGDRLKVTLVEVNYGPGEASPPHSHSCAVLGYVVAGAIRSEVKGEPEKVFIAGESFYEAPNGVHAISANASASEPARFVAYLICDRDVPLSTPVAPAVDSEREKQ